MPLVFFGVPMPTWAGFIATKPTMMSMQPATRISEFNLSLKDILTIITILASAMGSYFTISSQISQLASKFEDYRTNQEKLYQSEKGLIDLQLRTLELRIERMEQQNLK